MNSTVVIRLNLRKALAVVLMIGGLVGIAYAVVVFRQGVQQVDVGASIIATDNCDPAVPQNIPIEDQPGSIRFSCEGTGLLPGRTSTAAFSVSRAGRVRPSIDPTVPGSNNGITRWTITGHAPNPTCPSATQIQSGVEIQLGIGEWDICAEHPGYRAGTRLNSTTITWETT